MRDKLIGLLANAFDERTVKCLDCFDNDECLDRGYCDDWTADIADYLIASGVTVQEWIPVSERLPEYSGLTLVRVAVSMLDVKVNVPSIKRYVNEEKAWVCRGEKMTNVTHWMLLPAAPKEGK